MQINHRNVNGKPLVSDCEGYVVNYLNRHSEEYKVNDLVKSFGRLLSFLGDTNLILEEDIRYIVTGSYDK
jgi:hypothetical protein